MSEVKKPMEFWIRWQDHWTHENQNVITNVMRKDHNYKGDIHVIEKSAYLKAVEELKFVIKFCEKEGIYLTRSVDVLKELGVEA